MAGSSSPPATDRGFIAEEKEIAAQTKSGRQVVNIAKGDKLILAKPVKKGADALASVGTNRKLLVFGLEEMPVMARGRGVILQRHRDAYLCDVTTLRLEEGLSWPTGSRTRHEKDLTTWIGKRGSAGRMAPIGFPRSHKFDESDAE